MLSQKSTMKDKLENLQDQCEYVSEKYQGNGIK